MIKARGTLSPPRFGFLVERNYICSSSNNYPMSFNRMKSPDDLKKEVLPIIDKINRYTFKKKNEIESQSVNSIEQLLDLYLFAQYIERYSIEIRFLITRYSLSLDEIMASALKDPEQIKDVLNTVRGGLTRGNNSAHGSDEYIPPPF